jgi:hypothetical protein
MGTITIVAPQRYPLSTPSITRIKSNAPTKTYLNSSFNSTPITSIRSWVPFFLKWFLIICPASPYWKHAPTFLVDTSCVSEIQNKHDILMILIIHFLTILSQPPSFSPTIIGTWSNSIINLYYLLYVWLCLWEKSSTIWLSKSHWKNTIYLMILVGYWTSLSQFKPNLFGTASSLL